MIQCKECGYMYDDNIQACPKCGNPSHLSIRINTCPGCGAELHNIQGYDFVCEYCGTTTPVDSQTRAMIDAQQKQAIIAQQIENNKVVEKNTRKGCLIVIIVALCAISIPIGISLYSDHKAKQERAEAIEKYQQIKQDVMSGKPQSAYIAPGDIFVNNNKDRIGHLNQNLITTLKQKGYVEDGALTYSYYVNGKPEENNSAAYDYNYNYDPSQPLIKIELNSYNPSLSYGHSERLNEAEDVHSVSIIIQDEEIRKAYQNNFKKDLRNIGFSGNKPDYDLNVQLENKNQMDQFDLIRVGTQKTKIDTIFSSEYYTSTKTQISLNWDGVSFNSRYISTGFSELTPAIVCVGFRVF